MAATTPENTDPSALRFANAASDSTARVLPDARPAGLLRSIMLRDTTPAGDPLHVLLVEDTPASRRLALRVLNKRGHDVEVAIDGQEAVEKFEENANCYDVILMDLLMPRMDGLQATHRIRDFEAKNRGGRTPIIAITACSMRGDRDRCLAAGMDGYLPKPLDLPSLIRIVESAAQFAEANPQKDNANDDAETHAGGREVSQDRHSGLNGNASDINTSDIADLDEALKRLQGDKELLCDMIGFCEQDTPELLDKVHSTYDAKEWGELRRAAHTIKGLVSTFDAMPASDAARAVEEAAEEREANLLPKMIEQLDAEVQRLVAYLKVQRDQLV